MCVCTNKRAFTYIKSNEYDSMYGFHTVLKNIFFAYIIGLSVRLLINKVKLA
ncbi:hypothetical protein BC2903_32750 [Bacillus cereus]|nr:hypothetical protein BC2903_32750 [Bacillus cereus]